MLKSILTDIKTELKRGDRGSFRSKRILISAGTVLGTKGINFLVMLLSVPLTYNYLGEERFGLLMLVLSLVMFMGFADLGLGYGLLNKVAKYDLARDDDRLKKSISSSFIFLVMMSIFLLLLFGSLYSLISWNELLNVTSPLAKKEAGKAIQVFILCFCFTLPFTIVARLQSGYQENHINQLWEGAGNLFSLVALFIAVRLKTGVPVLVLALYGSQCLFILFNFCFQFFVRRRHLFPSMSDWNWAIFKDMFRDSIMLFSLQVASMLINAIDSILIARYVGPVAVGAYAIGYRLFSIFILPVQAFLSPILPAFNDAMESKDVNWLMRGSRKSFLAMIVASCLLSILFILTANLIIPVWISKEAILSWPLLIAFGFYIVFQNASSFLFAIMMSPVFLKNLFTLFGLASIIVVIMKIVFINSFHYSSVIWAAIVGATFIFILPGYSIVHKQLKKMREQVEVGHTTVTRQV